MRRFAWLRLGGLGRSTLFTTSGLIVRAALQACYLIVLSRWLGAEGYGLFAGSVAAAILLAPLSGWGMGYVFTEQLAQGDIRRSALWRSVSRQAAVSGLLLALGVTTATGSVMPIRVSVMDMALLALAELVALPLAQVASVSLMAMNRGGLAAVTVCLVPALRLAGMVALVALGTPASTHVAALMHGLASLIAAPFVLFIVGRVLKQDAPGAASPPGWSALFKAGTPYAASAFAGNAYFEVDKVLVLQLVSAAAAGTYTAAFRVVIVFILPIMALLANALPRLFVAASAGTEAALLKRVAAVSVVYGLVGAMLALAAAPFLPLVFGPEYGETTHFVTLLAAWIPLFALHQCGATALVASGGKSTRLAVESAGLVLVVALNLLLLPRMGANGAALALLATEMLMTLACWCLLGLRKGRVRSRQA